MVENNAKTEKTKWIEHKLCYHSDLSGIWYIQKCQTRVACVDIEMYSSTKWFSPCFYLILLNKYKTLSNLDDNNLCVYGAQDKCSVLTFVSHWNSPNVSVYLICVLYVVGSLFWRAAQLIMQNFANPAVVVCIKIYEETTLNQFKSTFQSFYIRLRLLIWRQI